MDIKEIITITQSLKLLYVEDDITAQNATVELLSNFFDNIVVAENGQAGLEKFKEEKIDIILSDINMPQMTGIEMVKEIKKLNEQIPVVFLTAHNENSFLSDGIELGVDGYLLKPLQPKSLIKTLSKISEKIHLQNKNNKYQENLEKEVRKQTRELDNKLHFDELTGLHSKYSFDADISLINTPIVLIVNINKFRMINEIYGVEAGSFVLKEFANFLLDFINNTSYKVYRPSGDEFILLDTAPYISHEKYEQDLDNFFTKLKLFSIDIDNHHISLEVTVGLSLLETDALACANIALNYAKIKSRDYCIYSSLIDTRESAKEVLKWKDITKEAIKNNRIVAVYQPIVDKNQTIIKHETLMRLRDEKDGKLISPYYFLDIAIKTGLYRELSTYIIFEALHLIDNTEHTLSVNFAYSDITCSPFLNELESFFHINTQLGKRVIFEITESEDIESYNEIKEFIKRFRAYGIRFAIDDFGSGFSNFEYILEIEPDYLKIDGSLIKNIDTDEKSHILVQAIVEFSHKLGIKIIAEFVHSEVIFDMLKVLNVDEYQGFYFSEPLEKI